MIESRFLTLIKQYLLKKIVKIWLFQKNVLPLQSLFK